MKRWWLKIITVLTLSIIVLAGCSPYEGNIDASSDGYTVRIGFPTGARDTAAPDGPDLWALKNGFFEEEFGASNIKIEYIPFLGAAPAINEALAAGSLDIAVIADIGALIGKAAGLGTSLVAMAAPDGTPWWLVAAPGSTLSSVEELRGKKVATVKATLPHFYLLEALKAHGMTEKDIQFIHMTLPDAEQALRAGHIDAAVTGTWMGVKLLDEGFRVLDSTIETPVGRGTSVIVARDGFIAEHPDFFSLFFQARQRGLDWANDNRDAAFDLLSANAGGIPRALLEPIYADPFHYDMTLNQDVLARIDLGGQFLLDLGITRNPVDVAAWIDLAVAYGGS
jgi:ABC-type nitrate/sulfonate/bicarbonate transport system substrate-binding protein